MVPLRRAFIDHQAGAFSKSPKLGQTRHVSSCRSMSVNVVRIFIEALSLLGAGEPRFPSVRSLRVQSARLSDEAELRSDFDVLPDKACATARERNCMRRIWAFRSRTRNYFPVTRVVWKPYRYWSVHEGLHEPPAPVEHSH